MTASITSASMVMRPVSFQGGRRRTGLGGVTGWHICDGSRPAGGQASDQVNAVGQAGPAAPGTGQKKGTPTAAKSAASHPAPPAPILTAVHPGPPGTTLTNPRVRGSNPWRRTPQTAHDSTRAELVRIRCWIWTNILVSNILVGWLAGP